MKPKKVLAVMTSHLELKVAQLKKNVKFKLGGVLDLKFKRKAAVAARKGQPLPRSHVSSRPSDDSKQLEDWSHSVCE